MAMGTEAYGVTRGGEQVMAIKDRLKTMLPERVLDRIDNVSEEYMLDRHTCAMKIRFDNGLWSPALLIDDRKWIADMFGDLKDMALNADEFIAWCCMMYEAGDGNT